MRELKVEMSTPEHASALAIADVWAQDVLRDDADKKSAFWVPWRHEQSKPSRQETHRMATSRLPTPDRSNIARDRDLGSPTT